MLVFAIDDEEATLEELRDAIAKAEPGAGIRCFRRAAEALAAVEEGERPEVAFSDSRRFNFAFDTGGLN